LRELVLNVIESKYSTITFSSTVQLLFPVLDRHFINGELVPPVLGQYLDVVDPAEESVWGRSAAGTNSAKGSR
jgi:hypothetical protein